MAEIQGVHQFDQEPLLANQFTVSHGADRFTIDFRNMVPQFGPNGEPSFVLVHRVVQFDPYFLKNFVAALQENIKKYETQYGGIKKPEAVLKAEKDTKKTQGKLETTSDKISYVG